LLQPETRSAATFSLDPETLGGIFRYAKPLGHYEDAAELNLGFGFLYYGLARMLRPRHVLVIGSGYGFSVVCLALGLKDNGKGAISFVDPSYSLLKDGPLRTIGGTSQWDEPAKVRAHFARFGVEDRVQHYRETSAEFFQRFDGRSLPGIDIAFIDGNHSYADVRRDFAGSVAHAQRNGYILLHDTNIYVREMIGHSGVKRWLRMLERDQDHFEVVDFPFSSGVAIVRIKCEGWRPKGP
jgi:predicted O-methyltransferase YrrM